MSASQSAIDSVSNAASQPLKYLDRAVMAVKRFGISADPEDAPILALVSRLESVDRDGATAVARVLQQSSMFNAVVRDHIDTMTLADRYQDIASDFDSIRKDSRRMLDSINDGKYSLRERIHQFVMRIRRGSIPARYQRIRETYLDVARDSYAQIESERAILEAYADYRLAVKSAEVIAYQLFEKASILLQESQGALGEANNQISNLDSGEGSARAQLEMTRDEASRSVGEAERRFQLAKDLAESIKVSYATGEVVMSRLQQTTEVKDRVYQRAVTFFTTNETVFTGLNAATSSVHGLHESTQTLNVMEQGINAGLEDLADIGGDVLREGVKAGHGAMIRPESVKKLVDSVVSLQSDLQGLTKQLREEATANANEVAVIVETGKQQFMALTASAGGQ